MLYLTHDNIDKQRWDECIAQCSWGLIYAKTFYLDHISNGWSALIGQDYEWVLPLTSRKKWGIGYLAQPPFTQQLGWFAKPGVDIPIKSIVKEIQQRFKYAEVFFNWATNIKLINSAIQTVACTNYVLDLTAGYDTIAKQYNQDLVKNLKKSNRFGFTYLSTTDYIQAIDLFYDAYSNRIPHVHHADFNNFKLICKEAYKNNLLICRQVVDDQDTMLAVALLLYDGRRIYNMMNTTLEKGRKTGANHFLVDAVIKEFAGQQIIFDFEGSDLPGVKSFYQNFGGINQPYFKVKYNNLPWPLQLLKE